ncbi:kinesin-like protein KIN-7D, mitochondrial isoform X2 [Tasmannia lanceolata]|uniref:kinesin-like protein KIN-7D, mitochondrial isoform X2 n=1 Tax=Tasmannia lanceolata TaxID=3420 RepID=UPI0040640BE2
MAASSSRGRSSSPFGFRKPSTSYSSSSSSSSRIIPRSCSSSVSSSFYGSGFTPRSITPSRGRSDLGSYPVARVSGGRSSPEMMVGEVIDRPSAGDSISVTVRFRPLSEREFQRGDEIAWYPDGEKFVRSEYNPATGYAFDRVFGPATTSKVVYDVAARPVVKAAMEGVNGTVFAYGVTSSGKTHTMHGDHQSPGIIPLAIKDVFSIIQDTPGREFLLRVSYLEIYNEVINDLLDPTGQNLRVREDAQGTYVEGIKEEVVLSPGHALSFIAAGEEHRHVGSNNFNLFSSRSHTIFTLMVESSAHGDEYDGVIFSQLNLIDLAGSESSKTETTGLRRKEGSYINKSLLTLGTVIGKLSDGKASHVPYRDSKLTRLLQSSLSGHGHVSLICTVTPASSNMEETHNTLKFASRAKRVEIFASRNRIIDEKSLIKKYQSEISCLKQELEQLKKGMVAGVNHDEIITLRQKLEEGQVKMQSRLEEEEEAKAALMSRIQRLTKLILVSTKNTIPGCLNDAPSHQRRHSFGKDDKLDALRENSPLLLESENMQNNSSSLVSNSSDSSNDLKHIRSSSKLSEEQPLLGNSVTDSTQAGELISTATSGCRLPTDGITMSDQMDLLAEQVKMLAGEIAFSTSTLKRLLEQSVNDPTGSQIQIQNLECEIQEKRRQMRVLEQRIMESGEASMANASLGYMQQTVMRLMTQCNEKGFELEIKSADNRILQEQLHNKEVESEKLKLQHVQLIEENSGLRAQNQNSAEDASYAKELASAAAIELKNLASEVTKLSLQNARQAKELLIAKDMAYSRGSNVQNDGGGIHKYSESKIDGVKIGRRGRLTSRGNEISNTVYDDVESWNLGPDDIRMELQARKQREAALEAALAEKELAEEEYRKKVDEAKKREASLENDLAGMWVLVAKLKKGGGSPPGLNADERSSHEMDGRKTISNDSSYSFLKERPVSDELTKPIHDELSQSARMDPLVVRLKARMQEMKEKDRELVENGEVNSHVCKVCFEAPTAAVLLPCRHFCLCKPCSLACSECPICRSQIADRIITFTS